MAMALRWLTKAQAIAGPIGSKKIGARKSVKILLAMSVILFHIFNVLVHVLYYVIRKIIRDVSHNLKNHNYDSV